MTIILNEWGLTTNSIEIEIKYRFTCDLKSKNLNKHKENMKCKVCGSIK